MAAFQLNSENLKKTGINFEGSIKIPFKFKNNIGQEYEIEKICDDALAYNKQIKALGIEDGITSIGKRAFNHCSNLEYVWIPESVVNVGFMAFENCENLRTVKWDSPQQLSTEMINYIFHNCPNLKEIVYHGILIDVKKDNIDKIIENLHERPVQSNVTTVDMLRIHANHFGLNSTFSLSEENKDEMGIEFSGNVTIPSKFIQNGVFYKTSQISSDALAYNHDIISVNIENGITNIDKYAFSHCSNLREVTIPESVVGVGFMAFENCENLRTVKWDSPMQLSSEAINYIFYNCPNLENIIYHGVSIDIKKDDIDKVIKSLNEKQVAPNVATIDMLRVHADHLNMYEMFNLYEGNKNKIGIDFSGDVTIPRVFRHLGTNYRINQIQSDTFAYNKNMTSVNIENGITRIGKYAFNRCSNLKSVTIPESVEFIDKGAFECCKNLTEVNWDAKIPLTRELIDDIFKGCDKLEIINYHGKEIKIKELSLDDIIAENTEKTRIESQSQSQTQSKPNYKYKYDHQTK